MKNIWERLIVIPKVVRVFAFIHSVVCSVGKLLASLETASVPYPKMALRAKQNAVAERVRAAIFSWFPVMRLPTPTLAFGSVAPSQSFATVTTKSTLPVPSLLYSVGGKGHHSTSRSLVANGWVNNGKGLHILRQNGKFTDVRIVTLPFLYQGKSKRTVYDIYHGNKHLGYTYSLPSAKRRAEGYFKKVRRG